MADIIPRVDYTSRDYSAIRADLINSIEYFAPQWKSRDPSDLGIVLLELYAYMGDLMSFYIDRAANEAFLDTAVRRSTVLSIANMFGYSPGQVSAASVSIQFTNTSDDDVIIPPLLQVATDTIMNSGVTPVVFETLNVADVTLAAGATTYILAREGRTISDEVLTYAFNGLPSQSFILAEPNVDLSSLNVYVGDVLYQRVDSLVDYPGTAQVFTTTVDASGNTYVIFGDNIGGRTPQLNSEITASYRSVNGSAGNVLAETIKYIVSSYTGGGLEAINLSAAVGGVDAESTYSIRENAPKSLRSLNRAVTLKDYESLAVQAAGVGKTSATAAVYSNINLYMAMSGIPGVDEFGDPITEWDDLATLVLQTLGDKIPPGVSVTVLPPTMVPVTISLTIKVDDLYKRTTVEQSVTKAITDLLAYDSQSFGQRVSKQQVSLSLGLIQGVEYSEIVSLYRDAVTTGSPYDIVCAANEIPYLDSLTITATGGIV